MALGKGDIEQHGSRLFGSDAVAEPGHPGATRGCGGILSALVRRYESVRNTCKSGHDHAEGYSIGETDTRGLGWIGITACWPRIDVGLLFVDLCEAKACGVAMA